MFSAIVISKWLIFVIKYSDMLAITPDKLSSLKRFKNLNENSFKGQSKETTTKEKKKKPTIKKLEVN